MYIDGACIPIRCMMYIHIVDPGGFNVSIITRTSVVRNQYQRSCYVHERHHVYLGKTGEATAADNQLYRSNALIALQLSRAEQVRRVRANVCTEASLARANEAMFLVVIGWIDTFTNL